MKTQCASNERSARRLHRGLLVALGLSVACVIHDDDDDDAGDDANDDDVGVDAGSADDDANDDSTETGRAAPIACAEDNGSINLPEGFCATVFAEGLGKARHMVVTPAGDLFVAVADTETALGKIVSLRDEDGDGVSDRQEEFGDGGGNGIDWQNDTLYFAHNDAVLRYEVPNGELRPTGDAQTVISGLPDTGDHTAKTVVLAGSDMFVNIGSASNSCQEENRVLESPGVDPCPELSERAGVWRYPADVIGMTPANGTLFAMGVRNANALALAADGELWAAQNGRDQLFENWPQIYDQADDDRLPSEEIFHLTEAADYGWPYCYYDAELEAKVLAPEYGGDGEMIGQCAEVALPDAVLPAHWAPLGITFYRGAQFPEHYKGGMFVATHGSRFAPDAESPPGYSVVFIPFADGAPSGDWEPFAVDFAGPDRPLPDEAEYRPVGVAEGNDGSLFISDDVTGRIWRVYYQPD